jgi:WD40 repeat protein
VYLYNTADFTSKAKIRKSSSYITHIDFSSDSVFCQTNDGSYELLYYDAETGIQQVSATAMKDVDWATWTCTLGWPVQGIWPAFSDGTDINAVDRSHNRQCLATADDFGLVKIFRNPCVDKGSLSVQCRGHSSHVMNLRWLEGDKHLITVGGNDKCVFQWRVTWNDADLEVRCPACGILGVFAVLISHPRRRVRQRLTSTRTMKCSSRRMVPRLRGRTSKRRRPV